MGLEAWFLHPERLWALLLIVPLIILYLIRPKPLKQIIPSLMFLLKDRGKKINTSMLNYILRDILFLLQLLIILVLAFSLAEPYTDEPVAALLDNTILVLDDSASMWAEDNGRERWKEAASIAKNNLGKTNTIILAGDKFPNEVMIGGSAREAERFIDSWRPSHQATRLSPALSATKKYLEKDTSLVVISDFKDTDLDSDYGDTIKTLEPLAPVSLFQVGSTNVDNIGIVGIDTKEDQTNVLVKNYMKTSEIVNICAGDVCQDLTINPQETEQWTITTPPGKTEIKLNVRDDFFLDNTAFISAPSETQLDVLVVTNGDYASSFFSFAMKAINDKTPLSLNIEQNIPPKLVSVNHDLVVFMDVDPTLIVSRVIREATGGVADGKAAIILHQDDLYDIDYGSLLPLSNDGLGGFSPIITNTEPGNKLFADLDFQVTSKFFRVTPQKTLQVIAQTSDGNPVVAVNNLGRGKVLYYGLPKDAAFSVDSQYVIFWKRILDEISGRLSIQTLNYATGERIFIANEEITSPSGKIIEDTALLEESGFYEGDRTIAVNLANALESDLAVEEIRDGVARNLQQGDDKRPISQVKWFLIAGLVLLLFELLYLKWRGDA